MQRLFDQQKVCISTDGTFHHCRKIISHRNWRWYIAGKKCIYTGHHRTEMQQIQGDQMLSTMLYFTTSTMHSEKVFRISDEALCTRIWSTDLLRKKIYTLRPCSEGWIGVGVCFGFVHTDILTLIHPPTVTHTHVVRSHILAISSTRWD